MRVGRGKSGLRKEDSNRERSERIDVNVFGGDAVGKRRVRVSDGFFGSRSDTKGVGVIIGLGLDSVL